ncbi:MAG: ATP-binding protein, partial [Thermodesulfovibrionales bacterium]
IHAKRDGDHVEIRVKDTGIGIDEQDLQKLFLPFERIQSHLSIKVGGTGLGLYLTKKICNTILGGDISVSSIRGQGTTFIMRIPVKIEIQKGDKNEDSAHHRGQH